MSAQRTYEPTGTSQQLAAPIRDLEGNVINGYVAHRRRRGSAFRRHGLLYERANFCSLSVVRKLLLSLKLSSKRIFTDPCLRASSIFGDATMRRIRVLIAGDFNLFRYGCR